MPNIHGVLQGITDPSEEGWQQRVMERVHARQKASNQRRRGSRFSLYFDQQFRFLLDEAAHRRGMTLSAYARRAMSAFIAHDLGIPLGEVTKFFPRVSPYGEVPSKINGDRKRTTDDGEGFGNWSVC